MEPEMKDKVVVVTGANSGSGKMTAVGLARAGATVIVACRDLAKSRAAQADVRSLSGSDRVRKPPCRGPQTPAPECRPPGDLRRLRLVLRVEVAGIEGAR